MTLGGYLTKYRREAGLTLDQLAAASGVPKGTINKIIAGTTKSPTLETLQALAGALDKTVGDFMPGGSVSKNAPPFSGEARALAKLYDSLDRYGKDAVREVAAVEKARCEDEERFLRESAFPAERAPRIIQLFEDSSAAGFSLGVTGSNSVPYELRPDDPQGAAFAVRVRGDSMEPYFPDGSIAFVNHDEMRDGDVGVFSVNGADVLKQWHYDPVLRMTYLFSLNRSRADADVVITANSGISLVWQGRVVTKRRFDLPV